MTTPKTNPKQEAVKHFEDVAARAYDRRANGLPDDPDDKFALFFAQLLDDDDEDMNEFAIALALHDKTSRTL